MCYVVSKLQDDKLRSVACKHPPSRLYSWVAHDARVNKRHTEYDKRLGEYNMLVVCCLDCHAILRGGVSDE